MRPLHRTVVAALAAATAATLAATLVAAPASAVPTTAIRPGKLPRGADVTIPHLEGKVVVDGSVRVRIKAPAVDLLGKSGTAYIVGTADRDGSHGRILRVNADGTSTKLGKAPIYETDLSDDSLLLATTTLARTRKSTVRLWSAVTGATVAEKTFKGYVNTLDVDAGKVLLGKQKRTWIWTAATGTQTTVAKVSGYNGDLSADVLASYTKDPYMNGCTVVQRMSTGERLWKSCKERVDKFNADGSGMATIDLLSDGIGPGQVWSRSITGTELGHYTIPGGWFGGIEFETTTALLLEANGARKAATVRCTGTSCERAGDLRPVRMPRMS